MPLGQCALCRNHGELRDSHLLPAGVYAILRSRAAGEHPVFITPSGSFLITRSKRLSLCDACEDRFNRRGEEWTLKRCWRSATEFPLRDALQRAVSVEVEPGPFAEPRRSRSCSGDLILTTGAVALWPSRQPYAEMRRW